VNFGRVLSKVAPAAGQQHGGNNVLTLFSLTIQNTTTMSEQLELSTTTTTTTMKPHENDVLLGRGGKNNQHVGNENLRNLARQLFAQDYRVSRKKGKSNMSRDLVVQVRQLTPPGRYVLYYF
jgi:hypothetical protein